eukprot:TRINITY_DN1197_c0_g1_i3.p1 TRINITY_DN1197_c0_g1~~TRINITY_DN1197_c0_g1_i3.p1  ORF type:complete len:267 (+),score=46.24 TRINITY_DN1197_c0_g1_i3:46-801(+)
MSDDGSRGRDQESKGRSQSKGRSESRGRSGSRSRREKSGSRSKRGRSDSRSRKERKERTESVDSAKVQKMCDKRQLLRKARNYDAADDIQAELKRMGVETDDKRCEWYSKCGKRGTYDTFGRRQRASSVDSEEVDDICQQRQNAKNAKDYRRADELRDELHHLGVSLSDNDCTWYCRFSKQRGSWSRWGKSRGRRYIRRGRSPSSSSSYTDSRDRRRRDDRKRSKKRRRSTSSSSRTRSSSSHTHDRKRRR